MPRTRARNCRAPGSQAMRPLSCRCSPATSRPSSRLQCSMQYQSSVPSHARNRGIRVALGRLERDPARDGVGSRNRLPPEVVVEPEVKQRAIEIEQYRIDVIPAGSFGFGERHSA